MRVLHFANAGILLLASAVLCYGQHGHGGHTGGQPSMTTAGNSGNPSSGQPSMTTAGNSGNPSSGQPPMTTGGNSGNPSSQGPPAGSKHSQKPSLQDQLDDHKKLTANLEKLLPTGTTAQSACQGLKNLGECASAIHVAHNLGISISDLTGKLTGTNRESLGKAIHDLRPDVDAGAEKKKAEKQAKADMNESAS